MKINKKVWSIECTSKWMILTVWQSFLPTTGVSQNTWTINDAIPHDSGQKVKK